MLVEEFTVIPKFFNLSFLRKLRNAGFNLAMAVCAHKDAFIKFCANLFPRTGIALITNPKIFFLCIEVVKVQRSLVFVITAYLTLAPLVGDCHRLDFPSAFCNGANKILASVCIFSPFSHYPHYTRCKSMFTGRRSAAELPGNIFGCAARLVRKVGESGREHPHPL